MASQTKSNLGVTAVIARFPQHWEHIRLLTGRDNDFDAVCEEYALAKESLDFWKASRPANSVERIAEYELIIAELEDELGRCLRSREAKQG